MTLCHFKCVSKLQYFCLKAYPRASLHLPEWEFSACYVKYLVGNTMPKKSPKNFRRVVSPVYICEFLKNPPGDSCFYGLKWSLVHWGTIYHKSSRGIFHDNFDPQMPDYTDLRVFAVGDGMKPWSGASSDVFLIVSCSSVALTPITQFSAETAKSTWHRLPWEVVVSNRSFSFTELQLFDKCLLTQCGFWQQE